MKKIYIIFISLLLAGICLADNAGLLHTNLYGKITSKNGEPVAGVSVYFPELKTGTVTDIAGKYAIENLPKRNMLIQVSALGYKMLAENIDLKTITYKDFVLSESIIEINEVVVTGQSGATQMIKMPNPMSIITQNELQQHASTNIIDAISSQPGISQITTGSGISKPVIRGLGYNRVVVINDGVRQEG
ncbi:MAG TPA: carboxypeptidase-like regulatory domain-containing protein, partial [Paludibacter sp.]|nr:carboxypeptidase-like regulatory domain-containing protein [Paludibacter sp.]